MRQDGRVAAVYHYYEKSPVHRDNLIFFLARAWTEDLDLFLVVAGACSVDLPQRDNIRVIRTRNMGHDFGSYAQLTESGALDGYDRLIFVNCTVRGPFLPPHDRQDWTAPFLDLLQGDVHLCGATINILHDSRPAHALYRARYPDDPAPYSHVQSSAHAMTGACFAHLRDSGLYTAAVGRTKDEVVRDCELRMSQLVRARGWNLGCLLPPYGALDYRKPHAEINPATATGHPQAPGAYFGLTPHPYELIFLKTGWGLLPPGGLAFHSRMTLEHHPRRGLDWPAARDLRDRLAAQLQGASAPRPTETAPTEAPPAAAAARAPARAAPPQPACLLVLGMHRSGTSALAGALTRLGAAGPKTPMAAHDSNPRGFFESIPVRDFNDALLRAADSSWKDWRAIDPGWFGSDRARAMQDAALRVLDGEFGQAPLFVLKDPRICRLLPFWRAVLARRGTRLLPLLTHRAPAEVAGSLAARYDFAPAFTHLLWLRHVLDAEADSRDLPRLVTSYARLLSDAPGVAAGIAARFGLTLADGGAAAEFVSEALRNQRGGGGAGLPAWPSEVQGILDAWAAGGERAADHPRLDAVRAEFGRAGPAFAPLIGS